MASGLLRGSIFAAAFLLGCPEPAYYAKRDYGKYPGYEPDIALHNINTILNDVCTKRGEADEQGIICETRNCLVYSTEQRGAVPNMFGGGSTGGYTETVCMKYDEPRHLGRHWFAFKNNPPQRKGLCVEYGDLTIGPENCNIKTRDHRQTDELVEAMEMFLANSQFRRTP